MCQPLSPQTNTHPLRAYRLRRGETQAVLAARARTSKGWLSRVELGDGEPSLGLIRRLAAATEGEVTVQEIAEFTKGAGDVGDAGGAEPSFS